MLSLFIVEFLSRGSVHGFFIYNKVVKKEQYIYKQGNKVLLLDKNLNGIVYKEADRFDNLTVLFNNEYLEINYNRLKIEFSAKELYPEGYDLNQLFSTFKERKFERLINLVL